MFTTQTTSVVSLFITGAEEDLGSDDDIASILFFFLENQTFEELGDVKALLTQPSSLITRPIWDSDYRGSTVSIRI